MSCISLRVMVDAGSAVSNAGPPPKYPRSAHSAPRLWRAVRERRRHATGCTSAIAMRCSCSLSDGRLPGWGHARQIARILAVLLRMVGDLLPRERLGRLYGCQAPRHGCVLTSNLVILFPAIDTDGRAPWQSGRRKLRY